MSHGEFAVDHDENGGEEIWHKGVETNEPEIGRFISKPE
jgi:hypothetical protein